jgi:hypothetical protein
MCQKDDKKIFKFLGIIVLLYFTFASCTILAVAILDQAVKTENANDLFPN